MDYTLSDLLYTGTDTRVVTGLRRDSQTPVVLKLPRHELPAEETLTRLRDEYALLRELDLPGIIKVLDLVPHGAGVALVLEHWGAGSLDRRLASGPLPVKIVLRLGAMLARVIGQVHQKGVIHCDIKPHDVPEEFFRR